MQLTDETVREYTERLASDQPTPGGGSAAALAGALAAASAAMVASFTVGREKFAEVQEDIKPILGKLQAQRQRLLKLTDADAEAYSQVGAAYGLPRDTEEEKQDRRKAIQEALKAAAEVPMEVAEACGQLIPVLPELAEKGNPNLISDVGVGAELALAALRCAKLNVEVNLALIKDEEYIAQKRQRLAQIMTECKPLARAAADYVRNEIRAQ